MQVAICICKHKPGTKVRHMTSIYINDINDVTSRCLRQLRVFFCNSLLSNHLGLYPQLRMECLSESQKLYDSMHGLLIGRMPGLFFPQMACFFVSTRDVMHCHAPAALAATVAARIPSLAGELAASAPPLPSHVLHWHIRKTLQT